MSFASSVAHANGIRVQASRNLLSVTCVCNCRCLISRCLSTRAESLATVCKLLSEDFSRPEVERDCLQALPIGTICYALGGDSKPFHQSLCGMAHAVVERIDTSLHIPTWNFLPMSEKVTDNVYMTCTINRTHKTIEHPFGFFGTNEASKNGKSSNFLVALDPKTGLQTACTSVAGYMQYVVCIQSGIGVLLTTSNNVLCLWDTTHQRRVWEHPFENQIHAITCPHNDSVICITKSSIVSLNVETGSQLFKNDAVLTTPRDTYFHCGKYEGAYEGTRYEGVAHSKDMMFVAFLQVYSLEHDPYHEDNPGGIDEEDLWIVAIDLQTGNEVWARNEDSGGPMGPQLEYSESAGLVFVATNWCCHPSSGEFFAYDSLTGQRRVTFALKDGIPKLKVVNDLIVFIMDDEGLNWGEGDQKQEYQIVVKKCKDCSPSSGELFRFTSEESIADLRLMHDRFIHWVTYTGIVVLIDMITGTKLLETPSGYDGSWSLSTRSLTLADDHLLKEQQPEIMQAWFMATLRLVTETENRGATLKLRCRQLKPYMSKEHYRNMYRMVYQKIQDFFFEELGIQI